MSSSASVAGTPISGGNLNCKVSPSSMVTYEVKVKVYLLIAPLTSLDGDAWKLSISESSVILVPTLKPESISLMPSESNVCIVMSPVGFSLLGLVTPVTMTDCYDPALITSVVLIVIMLFSTDVHVKVALVQTPSLRTSVGRS